MTDKIPEDLAPQDLSNNPIPDASGDFHRSKVSSASSLNRILRASRMPEPVGPTPPYEEPTGFFEAGKPKAENIKIDTDAPENIKNQINSPKKPWEVNQIIPQEEL